MNCPNCQSNDISELNLTWVRYPIEEWDEGMPTKFGAAEIIGDTAEPKLLRCQSCSHEWEPEYIVGQPA